MMSNVPLKDPHTFHIPVMGTGFTVDTPLKVARYGISSVISLVDDVLLEQMRRFHSAQAGEPYEEISDRQEDARARRVSAYLNLLQKLIDRQVAVLQASSFDTGSEILRYYSLLPEGPRKRLFRKMQRTADPEEKRRLQDQLRLWATPGRIDVNIMTKVDRDAYRAGQKLAPEQSDALSALRGFAQSHVRAAVVFSAGMNLRLYSYIAQFSDFLPDAEGRLKKQVILKVSDFRSAAIQGKFLAKRGIWVSEYRIESGLNCGGHAFATEGHLLGPILEQFRTERKALAAELLSLCNAALQARGVPPFTSPPAARVTVQGGIGTAAEQELLLTRYQADATGWGSPFLLVPEVTHVDEVHLNKLLAATEQEVRLSNHSPLGIPFWTLTTSSSELLRQQRVDEGHPGSRCPKSYLALNTEFTQVPLCPASQAYQRLKLRQIAESSLSLEERRQASEEVQSKTCICHDLAGGAVVKNNLQADAATAICPGPNIVNFKKIATLREMVDHIYGRASLLARRERSHMFVNELRLYLDYFRQECQKAARHGSARMQASLAQFKAHLLAGITHYQQMAQHVTERQEAFLQELHWLRSEIEEIQVPAIASGEHAVR